MVSKVPRISAFYGIVIWMYRPDHPPPHFHAQYGQHWARITLDGATVLEGQVPIRALRLIREWAGRHLEQLQEDWRRAQTREELLPIEPLE